MNRERGLTGNNSYERELRFSIVDYFNDPAHTAWLDLCCGNGKALVQLNLKTGNRVECHGVDLIDWFPIMPPEMNTFFHKASLHTWSPAQQFDLITCVHGLHYIGDKLGLLSRIGQWLKPDGLFIGHLDLANITHQRYKNFWGVLGKTFKRIGMQYNTRTRILSFKGNVCPEFPYRYVEADDTAGPNFTGQDAIRSEYTDKSDPQCLPSSAAHQPLKKETS